MNWLPVFGMSKYALKDSYGNIFELNPDDMHHRLASEIARIERNYPNPMTEEQIFEVLRVLNILFRKEVR